MRLLGRITNLVGVLLIMLPNTAVADSTSSILITQIQTGTTSSASQEFIELFNTSGQNVDVSSYKLEYYSASSDLSTPSRSIQLHGVLHSKKYYLVASTGYLSSQAYDSFSAGLSSTGGHILLVSPDASDATKDVVHDKVGWGSALHPEGAAVAAADSDSVLLRKQDDNSNYIDTDDNSADFASAVPNPRTDNIAPESEPTTTDNTNQQTDDEIIQPPAANLLPIAITELLPNPALPASDSTDEYVELYNPNAEPIDLDGYKLQTGNSFSYSHTFEGETIPANSYVAFKVSLTGALLANSGGKARLIDPAGRVISETAAYENAKDGQAWALVDGEWVWTTTPTPNDANILVAVLGSTSSSTKAKSTKTKTAKKVAPKASTKKVATSKKNAAIPGVTAPDNNDGDGSAPTSIHPGILAGVSALALGYAAYEYRHDMANKIYQLRRYRAARRAARASAKGL
jgi:hypothetical protein